NLLLARHRPPNHPSHRQSRLLPGPGMHSGNRPNLHRSKFPDGLTVLGGQPEDKAVSMLHALWIDQSSHLAPTFRDNILADALRPPIHAAFAEMQFAEFPLHAFLGR